MENDPIFKECVDAMVAMSKKFLWVNTDGSFVIREFHPADDDLFEFAVLGLEISCGWSDGLLEGWNPSMFAIVMCAVICEYFGAGAHISKERWCNALAEVLLCFTQDIYATNGNIITKSSIFASLDQLEHSSQEFSHPQEHRKDD